jgi:hypothetical protein
MRGNSALLARYSEASAACSGVIWLGSIVLDPLRLSFAAEVAALLRLAFFVIMPLVLRLVVVPRVASGGERLSVLVITVQPLAAVGAAVALLPLWGALRVGGAGLWLLYTVLVAFIGLQLVGQQRHDIAAWCRGAALIYLPIGAAWFLFAQAHIAPIGLDSVLVSLTAVHFHYIPLVALTMTGLVGGQTAVQQRIAYLIYRSVAVGMLIIPVLVGAGITLTQLTGNRGTETVAALLQALTVILLGGLLLGVVVPSVVAPLARVGLALAGAAVFVSMLAASAFALGNATGAWALTYTQMLLIHGWVNALLFGVCGLGGWVANAHTSVLPATEEE